MSRTYLHCTPATHNASFCHPGLVAELCMVAYDVQVDVIVMLTFVTLQQFLGDFPGEWGLSDDLFSWGDAVALLAGHRICDSQVAGFSGLRQASYTCVPLSPSSIIWYQAKCSYTQQHRFSGISKEGRFAPCLFHWNCMACFLPFIILFSRQMCGLSGDTKRSAKTSGHGRSGTFCVSF